MNQPVNARLRWLMVRALHSAPRMMQRINDQDVQSVSFSVASLPLSLITFRVFVSLHIQPQTRSNVASFCYT